MEILNYYERDLRRFLKINIDKTERDFINHQLELLEKDLKTKETTFQNIDDEQLRKLAIEKNGIGYDFENYPDKGYPEDWMTDEVEKEKRNFKSEIGGIKQYIFEYKLKLSRLPKLPKEKEDEPLDFSDTKATEKIIFLKELGILDFLRESEPFQTSTNALASVISAFTGIPITTAQPYLNPIINSGIDQKNNPFSKEKTVNKVKQKLISIGYRPPYDV